MGAILLCPKNIRWCRCQQMVAHLPAERRQAIGGALVFAIFLMLELTQGALPADVLQPVQRAGPISGESRSAGILSAAKIDVIDVFRDRVRVP